MTPITGLAGALLVVCPPLLLLAEHRMLAGRLVDRPNERSSHQQPTPRGGGIAIVVGTLLATWVYWALAGASPPRPVLLGLGGALVISLVSLADDLRSLPPVARLAFHLGVSLAVVAAVPLPEAVELPVVGTIVPGFLAAPLGVLWLVGLTNVYNFMDGIDGIAAGQAIVAGLTWAVLGRLAGAPLVVGLGLGLAGSSAIFLWRNWPPARLFMGDAGSAFLGMSFALLPLLLPLVAPGAVRVGGRAFAVGVLALWPFLFDASLTVLRRARRGENILQAHRSHLYQRLVIAGRRHGQVSLLYTGLAAAGAAAGLAWLTGELPGWPAAAVPVAGGTMLVLQTRRMERSTPAA